ncbi:MAG: endolytic transglycosylase MltG [bacterium]|nr:endolytic transglycosylase MltG [bacterium]
MKLLIEETILFTIGFVLLLAAIVSGSVLWWYSQNTKPFSSDTTPLVVKIKQGSSFADVALELENKKIIRSAFAFRLNAKLTGAEFTIHPGDHSLSPSMDFTQIEKEISKGQSNSTRVQLREGLRVEEIATLLSTKMGINFVKEEFLQKARIYEGMLFPDTYEFEKEANASDVIEKLNNQFEKKYAQSKGPKDLVLKKKIIVIASLLEREGKSDNDRPVIAGIIQNRLEIDMPLQLDATFQYAVGERKGKWWSSPQVSDKEIVSPFNTYKNIGLPPSPICNPGINALEAAINPEKSNFLYYLHDTSGNIYYAKTLDEHNRNINNYL